MNKSELDLLWDRYLSGDPLSPADEGRLVEAFLGDAEFRRAVLEDEALDGSLTSMGQAGKSAKSFVESFIYRLGVEQDGRGFLKRMESRGEIEVRAEPRPKSSAAPERDRAVRRGRHSTRAPIRRSDGNRLRNFWLAALVVAGVLVAVTVLLNTRVSSPQETLPREVTAARSNDRAEKQSTPEHREKSPAPRPTEEERGMAPKPTGEPLQPKPGTAGPAGEPPAKPVGAPEAGTAPRKEEAVKPREAESPPPREPKPAPIPVPPAGEETRAAVATLEEIAGEVYRLTEVREVPATAGGAILAGEGLKLVKKGSRARLKYPDGTSVELLGDAEIRNLNVKGGKRLLVAGGSLWADVVPQPRLEPMVFETPHGEATVLGTTLRIVVDPDPKKGTRLEVETGRVRLKNIAGKPVDVMSGHYAVAAAGVEPIARRLSQNLLSSPGFERSAEGWKTQIVALPAPPLQKNATDFVPDPFVIRSLVPSPSRSGKKALAISAPGDRRVYQEMLVEAGASYYLEFWVKTRDLSKGGVGVSLIWYGDGSNRSGAILGKGFNDFAGTREWTRISAVTQAPQGVVTACFHISPASEPNAGGTAWFDDFILRKGE